MCVICYKPQNEKMPTFKALENCWNVNPDGAGYMFAHKRRVYIRKGFMDFISFMSSLESDKAKYGENIPWVLHFRISTQAGVNPECTHPFPLSDKMADLKKLDTITDIGIAHNGIIHLTSDGYSKTITYSDTMKFITDYMSLIVKDTNWWRDKNTVTLIERLIKSKLAVLDKYGHCELIGNFIEHDGCFYSNTSFEDRVYKNYFNSNIIDNSWDRYDGWTPYQSGWGDYYANKKHRTSKDDYYEDLEDFYFNPETEEYDLDPENCPWTMWADCSYCGECSNSGLCPWVNDVEEEDLLSNTDNKSDK